MVDPISIASIVVSCVSAVGAIVVGIIQVLKGGWEVSGSCFSSDCCSPSVENDIHHNDRVIVK